MIQTTYSRARAQLASLLDRVTQNREKVIIRRRGQPDVALIAADELAGLEETAYLLRSPENARRLFEGLARAERNEGVVVGDVALATLKREIASGATYETALERAGIPDSAPKEDDAARA
ncbi:MAG: type II toxin-antitoxin system Phd/YefM family antitoxin [Chloroflexi bacterium]|nr:type II toxin-antitoxin system Phd/YefM family antitoxin [Chloroflexota bacterium]